MRKALEDQDYEHIKSCLLEGNESSLPEDQREALHRWVSASKLLEKNPVLKNSVLILQAKYPGLSRTQAYDDCRNAIRLFNSRKDFDFDLWRNWLLNDIVDLCLKSKETGNLKAWAAAQANLIKALGDAPSADIDPRLIEKHQILVPIQINNSTYNIDFNKFLKIPIDQRTRLSDALISPASDQDISDIINS
ncbi:MAG: hypothetical protein RR397_09940 [Odoribacter sp.]